MGELVIPFLLGGFTGLTYLWGKYTTKNTTKHMEILLEAAAEEQAQLRTEISKRNIAAGTAAAVAVIISIYAIRAGTLKRRAESRAQEALENQERALGCAVCYNNERCMVYRPCSHFAVCRDCDQQIEIMDSPCPICREPIISRIAVHVV